MLDILRIPLIAITDDGVSVDVEVPLKDVQPPHAEPLPADTVALRGTLVPVSDDLLFRGQVLGAFVCPCDRCLAEAETPFDIEVIWTFEEGPPLRPVDGGEEGEDSDAGEYAPAAGLHRFQGTEVDLNLPLWEELEFAAPDKFLCNEDCLGLCSVCGGNRNETPCSCETQGDTVEQPSNGLAGLADMFPDLNPEHPKE